MRIERKHFESPLNHSKALQKSLVTFPVGLGREQVRAPHVHLLALVVRLLDDLARLRDARALQVAHGAALDGVLHDGLLRLEGLRARRDDALHEGERLHGSTLDDVDHEEARDLLGERVVALVLLDALGGLAGDGAAHAVADEHDAVLGVVLGKEAEHLERVADERLLRHVRLLLAEVLAVAAEVEREHAPVLLEVLREGRERERGVPRAVQAQENDARVSRLVNWNHLRNERFHGLGLTSLYMNFLSKKSDQGSGSYEMTDFLIVAGFAPENTFPTLGAFPNIVVGMGGVDIELQGAGSQWAESALVPRDRVLCLFFFLVFLLGLFGRLRAHALHLDCGEG